MSKRSVQFPFLYTGNYNIRCFSNQKPNELTIKNDKIFFKTDIINANQPIDYLAIYKGQFKITSSLLFGINNKNPIQIQNGQYVRTIYVIILKLIYIKMKPLLYVQNKFPSHFYTLSMIKIKYLKLPLFTMNYVKNKNVTKLKYKVMVFLLSEKKSIPTPLVKSHNALIACKAPFTEIDYLTHNKIYTLK